MTLKSRFSARAHKMAPDAPFDLDAEVARAYREYPQLKGNTFFIDAASGRIVHPAGLSRKTEQRILRRDRVRAKTAKSKREKGSRFCSKKTLGAPYNVVFLYLESDSLNLGAFPPSYSMEQRKRAIFDHELGHALSLGTAADYERYRTERLQQETIAENFMLLRQFLRYGNNRKIDIGGLAALRASGFFTEDKVHENYFASPALEKIGALRNTFNLAALNPARILQTAIKTAHLHTPGPFAMQQLKDELRTPANPRSLLSLAKRTLKTDSEEAFKWGSKVLRFRMRRDMLKTNKAGNSAAFSKRHWPKIKGQIAEKERQLRLKR